VHGTRYDYRDGRLVRVVDRTGAHHAELTWSAAADRLVRLVVAGARVDGSVVQHPLLGDAHVIGDTAMTTLDWARPTEIPAIVEPTRLPLGAGGAVLNAIALLARDAGVAALRYAGPYPTAALWRSVARSFRCSADEAAFTAGALDRAARVARDPIAIDFAPAPHERIAIAGGFVELRDGLERAVVGGIGYEPGGSPARLVRDGEASGSPARLVGDDEASGSPARLVGDDEASGSPARSIGDADHAHWHCEIWFGDAPYARVATLAADGTLLAGPHPVPPCGSPVIGRTFPDALRIALAELVAEAVAAPLADDARALCAGGSVCWADLGARAAREVPGDEARFVVHAALWDRIAPLGLGRLALALAEALAPVVAVAVVRRTSPRSARGAW
jgi:hypothetical protein